MRHTPFRVLLVFSILLAATACRSVPAARSSTSPPDAVWSADFVTVKPGMFGDYLRFLEANWARARRTALAQGHIRSYRVLTAPDTAAGWQVILLTEYADSAAYARREAAFRPILDAQGRTPIGGRSTRELTDRIQNRVLRAPLGQP